MPDVTSGLHRADASGADSWRLFHFYPILPEPNGTGKSWTFLGEVEKIVPVSPKRFQEVGISNQGAKSCLEWKMNAQAAEAIVVGAVSPSGVYLEKVIRSSDIGNGDIFSICD